MLQEAAEAAEQVSLPLRSHPISNPPPQFTASFPILTITSGSGSRAQGSSSSPPKGAPHHSRHNHHIITLTPFPASQLFTTLSSTKASPVATLTPQAQSNNAATNCTTSTTLPEKSAPKRTMRCTCAQRIPGRPSHSFLLTAVPTGLRLPRPSSLPSESLPSYQESWLVPPGSSNRKDRNVAPPSPASRSTISPSSGPAPTSAALTSPSPSGSPGLKCTSTTSSPPPTFSSCASFDFPFCFFCLLSILSSFTLINVQPLSQENQKGFQMNRFTRQSTASRLPSLLVLQRCCHRTPNPSHGSRPAPAANRDHLSPHVYRRACIMRTPARALCLSQTL